MSLESILQEVEQLSENEKHAVLEVLQEHFAEEYISLSKAERQMIRSRLEHFQNHPETGISLEQMKQRHGL
ncbi:hypothetical protein [Spirochaeta lutea]|uniref:Addiction module protein n=1 Tax=Spirochaeta lutea TaxID=1480694 RepID=A0A098R082_9SPIO|nr:hypothetical protein [Spirochaeta lutea]KGE73304.1 hypothetical protein DC28_04690 [Spirochaeta lutea]